VQEHEYGLSLPSFFDVYIQSINFDELRIVISQFMGRECPLERQHRYQ
jgi:hypothetical protein